MYSLLQKLNQKTYGADYLEPEYFPRTENLVGSFLGLKVFFINFFLLYENDSLNTAGSDHVQF